MKKALPLILALLLLLSGCGEKLSEADKSQNVQLTDAVGSTAAPVDTDFAQTDADMFTERDISGSYSQEDSIRIELRGDTAAASDNSVVITGGEYVLSCASHGLDANDSVRIKAGTLTIHAGKDGIHAENTQDSAPEMVKGESYTIYVGTQSGTFEAS